MFLAHHVQMLAKPYVHKGTMSKMQIYLTVIVNAVPVCLSTFYRYMRMPMTDYPALMAEYAAEQREKAYLSRQRLNRRRRDKMLAMTAVGSSQTNGVESEMGSVLAEQL